MKKILKSYRMDQETLECLAKLAEALKVNQTNAIMFAVIGAYQAIIQNIPPEDTCVMQRALLTGTWGDIDEYVINKQGWDGRC